jgi:hypothetical protein
MKAMMRALAVALFLALLPLGTVPACGWYGSLLSGGACDPTVSTCCASTDALWQCWVEIDVSTQGMGNGSRPPTTTACIQEIDVCAPTSPDGGLDPGIAAENAARKGTASIGTIVGVDCEKGDGTENEGAACLPTNLPSCGSVLGIGTSGAGGAGGGGFGAGGFGLGGAP